MRTHLALGIQHFIKKTVGLVMTEQSFDRLRFGLGGHFTTLPGLTGKRENPGAPASAGSGKPKITQ
jgi:hypothetical protein